MEMGSFGSLITIFLPFSSYPRYIPDLFPVIFFEPSCGVLRFERAGDYFTYNHIAIFF